MRARRVRILRNSARVGQLHARYTMYHGAWCTASSPAPRYAVVIQSAEFPLSTLRVAPTSTAARAATFRPEVEIAGRFTQVLAKQTPAVDPSRLGENVGYLSFQEMRRVDSAVRIVMDL
jgi:mRNA interferase MazF